MPDGQDGLLRLTLHTLLRHPVRIIEQMAMELWKEPRLDNPDLTLGELLEHEDKVIQILTDSLYKELKAIQEEEGRNNGGAHLHHGKRLPHSSAPIPRQG